MFFVTLVLKADYTIENNPKQKTEVFIMKTKAIISSILTIAVLASFAGCAAQVNETAATVDGSGSVKSYGTAGDTAGDAADEYAPRATEGAAEFNKSETAKSLTLEEGAAGEDIAPTEPAEVPPADGGSIQTSLPEAGQLTAGEWKDNDNWGFFTNLVASGKIGFPVYGLDPTDRVMITVKDGEGKPAANVHAELTDEGGSVLWSGVTDYQGKVYLFSSDSAKNVVLERDGKKESYPVELQGVEISDDSDTQTNNQKENKKAGTTEMELTFEPGGKKSDDAQIMFIVDATGSMSDEMLFLQSEFSAIAREIGTDNTSYSVNFYRDEGDDYVTKCNDFTKDIDLLQKLLNYETATGGGDTPEAVAQILDETMNSSSWSDDSVKLAFLIFDAPPHEEDVKQLDAAIAQAAKKGIRIIPVVSSNSERETELFGRAAAIMTGGSYVFLTDDSNIGDSHLEPIIGDYKVEKLYDIIIRLINEYRQ